MRCEAAEMVVQVSAQRKTLYGWWLQSRTHRVRNAKAARKCGELRNGNGGLHGAPLGMVLDGAWKWSRTLPHGAKLCRGGHRDPERVGLESLRPRTHAALSEKQRVSYTELSNIRNVRGSLHCKSHDYREYILRKAST